MKRKILVVSIILSGLLLTGCLPVNMGDEGEYTLSEYQRYEDLEVLEVDIKMGVGQLNIGGDTQDLFQGNFIYSVDSWKPKVNYQSQNNKGFLSIVTPPGLKNIKIGKQEYQWDIALNEKNKIDLDLELGVGQSKLLLNTLNLHKADIEVGVGEATIDLQGDWEEDVEANIQGGVGKITILLPEEMNVEVKTSQGIGKISTNQLREKSNFYFNESNYSDHPVLRVDIKAGIGEIELK